MRKLAFCICENKGQDQLGGASLFLRHRYSMIPLLAKSKISITLAIFCGLTARPVLDVGTLKTGFLVMRLK